MMPDASDISMLLPSCLENQLNDLHVTAFFNGRGQAQRTSDYVLSTAFQEALGSATTLSIIAWTITPRTVTARVKLNPQQLKLWGHLDSRDLKEGCGIYSGTHLTVSTIEVCVANLLLSVSMFTVLFFFCQSVFLGVSLGGICI